MGVFAVSRLHEMSQADTFLYTRSAEPMGDLINMSVYFQRIRLDLLTFVTTDEDAVKQRVRTEIPQYRAIIDSGTTKVESSLISAEAQKILAEYKLRRQDFRTMTDDVRPQASYGGQAEGYALQTELDGTKSPGT